ncbi:SsrA-binding protein [Candidatus Curtissbacteria bacterium RBG_13_40_7]|uniref:SsrA-binding protein n=1 Tax=Candidatus Curtissbacteria bacterium RBG_13_40_7 TaxID=1797706 RepID=A0A1F5FVQ9_9BACT|nr:MAG: SsrA-binding protein [Candidatus Curtissbacteria bacterium RBG_13_40_7]
MRRNQDFGSQPRVKIFNRRARHKYQILDKVETGIVLTGAEIKSIRAGRVDLSEAFARIRDGQIFLVNAFINPWMGSQKFVDARRERKLLLHKRQILNWQGKIAGAKLTLVPLSIYIKGNLAKAELALAKSKAKFDKRAALRKKTIERDVERELRGEKS